MEVTTDELLAMIGQLYVERTHAQRQLAMALAEVKRLTPPGTMHVEDADAKAP